MLSGRANERKTDRSRGEGWGGRSRKRIELLWECEDEGKKGTTEEGGTARGKREEKDRGTKERKKRERERKEKREGNVLLVGEEKGVGGYSTDRGW